jgi:hypothetical protein
MARYSVIGLRWESRVLHFEAVHFCGLMRCPWSGRKAPVRTEPLPTALSVALCLKQSFSSSFAFSFSVCSWGTTVARG